MSQVPGSRKLAAVVVADVVGYSALMESDEQSTIAEMRRLSSDIVAPVTERFNGRVVKGTGDGWLAEFGSVTDAVFSSLEIQAELALRQDRTPQSPRLALRIGVSLGEITVDDGDVFGTGVNLAARLESIAIPGGVCVSDWAYQQVRSLPELHIDDMGPQSLKNLTSPVHTYMIYRRSGSHDPGFPAHRPTEHAVPLGRASVAVLPFANLSNDPSQDYFADGMVDDILTALARFKSLVVVARQSSFAYKGRAIDVREVGRELGVRYVLEGSVQRSDRRVRLTGQLIDAATGAHVWADRFEGDLADVFDLQDRLTDDVVGTLEPQIQRAEIERARRARPDSLDAHDLYLRALPHVYAMRPVDNGLGLELLNEAMRLDPGYIPARAFASWCYEQRLTRGWPSSQPDDPERAVLLARQTLDADTGDANAISIAGFVLLMVGRDYEPGLTALRDAVRLNPFNAFVLMNGGWGEVWAGSLDDAVLLLQRARSISPRDPAAYFVVTGLAMAALLSGSYDEATALASQAKALYPSWDATFVVLGLALAHSGRLDEAGDALERATQLLEGGSLERLVEMLPVRDPDRRAVFEEGIRLGRAFAHD
ncbi:MAG TPA: adenylate/guanylate cyclase domain-containing protein [Acidimicrobiia bacterium]